MSARDPLERLSVLEISSADFPDQIAKLLCGEEYRQRVPTLQGEALAWLVEFLDDVRFRILYPPFTEYHHRPSTISVRPTTLSQAASSSSDGSVALGRYYQNRPRSQAHF